MYNKYSLNKPTLLALLGFALTVTGCGGVASGAPDPVPTPVDSRLYADLLSYCKVTEPTALDASRDGWTTHLYSFDQYGTTTTGMVSASGSSTQWDTPLALYVSVLNGASGYGEQEPKMGVRIPTILAKQSVACVRQASHLYSPPALNIPGATVVPPVQRTVWDSYWDRALPISKLMGTAIYGFEFVSNFTPSGGDVFFNVSKARFTVPSTLSVCYLAPRSAQWDCVQPSLADAGTNWHISVRTPKPGVYVLISP